MALPGNKFLIGHNRRPKSFCTVSGCGRPMNARGLCPLHYRQAQEAGEFGRPCSREGCARPVQGRGLCAYHYGLARTKGELPGNTCSADGCNQNCHGRGLCRDHYEEAFERGDFGGPACAFEGCSKRARSKGYCKVHYITVRKQGGLGDKLCAVVGCNSFVLQRDKCASHMARARRYGLTNEDLAELDRGVPCAICESTATSVDHCHSTGAIRGYLCTDCNLGLGKMGDDPDRLRRAADYLEKAKRHEDNLARINPKRYERRSR